MSMNHQIEELLPGYALDCVEAEEARLIAEQLAKHPEWRQELRMYEAAADQLALAAPDALPPSDLKHRLMERIQPAGTRFLKRKWSEGNLFARLFKPAMPVWGVVGLALVFLLGVVNVLLWEKVDRLESQALPRSLSAVLLMNTNAVPEARGFLVMDRIGSHNTLIVYGLPSLGPEKQYQLWLIRNGRPTKGPVFSVSEDGDHWLPLNSWDALKDYTDFGVTVEPAGGSPQPTGKPVLGSFL